MHREYFIHNLAGVMYYKDVALFEFEIKERELISWKDLSNGELWPCEPKVWGMSYYNLNEFFKRRVVEDYAMWIQDYLDAIGLESYDFEEIVKRNNGWNHLDLYWVRFKGLGAQNYDELLNQKYPIYK